MEPGNFKDSMQSSVQREILEQHPEQKGIQSQVYDVRRIIQTGRCTSHRRN